MLAIQNNSKVEMQATLLVTLSAILYGFLGSLGTEVLKQHFSIPSMLFWRFFIATIWMLLWFAFNKKEKLFVITNRAVFLKACILSAIFYAGPSLFYFFASQRIGTGLAMVIFFTYPLFVVALTWLLDRHAISKHTAIALMAIVIGMLFIKGGYISVTNKLGIVFALVAALFYGIYIYASKKIVTDISAVKMTLLVCFSCTVVYFFIATIGHSFNYPTTLKSWFYICSLGIISTAVPIQLLLVGLRYIHPNKVSILSVLEPFVTLLIGVIILHEATSLLQTVGAAIILFSVVFVQFEK